MSERRDRMLVAQTKLHTAQRLIVEAAAELQAVLPKGRRVVEEVADLLVSSRRVEMLACQTIKRTP